MIVVLVSLGLTGVLFSKESKQLDSTGSPAKHAESQAIATASASIFAPVTQVLEVGHAESGTYLGAQLPAGSGVTIVQANTAAYCLQANVNGMPVHEIGPGGVPALGAC